MHIVINTPENDGHIYNMAFIRALLIKHKIEELDIDFEDKKLLLQEILNYLKNDN